MRVRHLLAVNGHQTEHVRCYLDRAEPRDAAAKFLVFASILGPWTEFAPGANFSACGCWSDASGAALRFLPFLAFARSRALAFVMLDILPLRWPRFMPGQRPTVAIIQVSATEYQKL